MSPSTKALIVFVKPPIAGEVKTRIGATLGYKKAARIYEQLLIYTARLCQQLNGVEVYVFHGNQIDSLDIWGRFHNKVQVEGDLGKKMAHAFEYCFKQGHKKVIGIGSDCISISKDDLTEAFYCLEKCDIVFGPAEDGGYYLIGMSDYEPFLFQNMPWSQPSLLLETLEKCKSECKKVNLLRTLSDIDFEEDLYKHKVALQKFNPSFFSFLDRTKELSISVIIPTLNEESTILKCIQKLSLPDPRINEIIVVDGGSKDQTVKIAKQSTEKAKVIVSNQKGRALQMNLGALNAQGNFLYFVHADTLVPSSYINDIEKQIKKGYITGGFRFKFDSKHPLLKLNAFLTRFPFLICRGGDQTLDLEKRLFDQVDGYKDELTIMEEYDLIQRVRKRGVQFGVIPKSVIVSARKYNENSYWKVQYANFIAFTMYKKGEPEDEIKKKYNKQLNLDRYE